MIKTDTRKYKKETQSSVKMPPCRKVDYF